MITSNTNAILDLRRQLESIKTQVSMIIEQRTTQTKQETSQDSDRIYNPDINSPSQWAPSKYLQPSPLWNPQSDPAVIFVQQDKTKISNPNFSTEDQKDTSIVNYEVLPDDLHDGLHDEIHQDNNNLNPPNVDIPIPTKSPNQQSNKNKEFYAEIDQKKKSE